MIAIKAPFDSWRFLEQQRQEDAFGQPQRQPTRQCQQQPWLSFLPELDEHCVEESTLIMDQTLRPVQLGQFLIDKPQGTPSAGRQVSRRNQAERSSGCRLYGFAK